LVAGSNPASGAIYTQKSLLNPDFIDVLRALSFVGFIKFVPEIFLIFQFLTKLSKLI
jgi:hypothetical protein